MKGTFRVNYEQVKEYKNYVQIANIAKKINEGDIEKYINNFYYGNSVKEPIKYFMRMHEIEYVYSQN
jgi:hypothetical protein